MTKPQNATSQMDWNGRASQLLAAQKLPELQRLLEQVLLGQPENNEARQLLGVAHSMQGRHAEGVKHLSLAIALSDFEPDWTFNLANILRNDGQTELALLTYRRLLVQAPGHAQAWFNLANLLSEQQIHGQAIDAYRRALLADPSYLKAMVNLASSLSRVGDFDGALKIFRQILASDPKHVGARNNMANLLRDLGQPQEARRILLELANEDPASARVQNNLGSAWREIGDLQQSLACYRKAIELKADYPEGQMNYAMALLTDGQWEPGWRHYEARLDPRLQVAASVAPENTVRWTGQVLTGKRILVHGEQGLGDMLQFCRFVPMLEKMGAEVFLLTDRNLKRLLQTLDMRAPVLSSGDAIPRDLHFQVSLLSLPLYLGIFSPTQFHSDPYLKAQPDAVARWQSQLDSRFSRSNSGARLRVGLVWAGNPRREMPLASLVDRRRSLPLAQARQLVLAHPQIDWVSLQKGEQEDGIDEIYSAASSLNDFADTAALCQALDAVVTVDTSVAHLCGSIGRPTIMLSRFDACWRWGLKGGQTPWYKSMRIVRQSSYGDWSNALQQVGAELDALGNR